MEVSNRQPIWRKSALRVLARCDQLATCSESPTNLTRTFLSPAMNEANELVANWMREASMTPRVDELGNLIGHYLASDTGASTQKWLLGSHLDTVPDAGKYDGALGVILSIEVVSLLQDHHLPFAVEVIGFSEEEGVRYKTPYLGSRAIAGTFDSSLLSLLDCNGIPMSLALRQFKRDPEEWGLARYDSQAVAGYLEVHIEQGPLLEALGSSLGIVTDIAGQSRLQLRFQGKSGHAGTQPMSLRHDALAATSEWVLAVESLAQATEGLVATVGTLDVTPNTSNVVAGETVCSLDVRHADDVVREAAVAQLLTTAQQITTRRGLSFEVLMHSSQQSVPMDAGLRKQLQAACARLNINAPLMASGAGHDATIMATLCPCAMMFLRTPGGASHCPEEAVNVDDVALALEAMHSFLLSLAHTTGAPIESPTFSRIGQSRTVLARDHALIAPDGHVPTPLPGWGGAIGVVLISPAMGARLAQTLVWLEPNSDIVTFRPPEGIEACLYILEGELQADEYALRAGSYIFLPAGEQLTIKVTTSSRLVVFEKRYAPQAGLKAPRRLIGHANDIQGKPFLGDPDATLQVLLPDSLEFDMAVNIFSYKPGATLPFVETHIMEHGLLMLEGEGIYRLNESWYPVAAGDCIWMAPYCPQWFAATGKVTSRYIYYKDINRDAMEAL